MEIKSTEELLKHQERGNVNPFFNYTDVSYLECLKLCIMWPVALMRYSVSIHFIEYV